MIKIYHSNSPGLRLGMGLRLYRLISISDVGLRLYRPVPVPGLGLRLCRPISIPCKSNSKTHSSMNIVITEVGLTYPQLNAKLAKKITTT